MASKIYKSIRGMPKLAYGGHTYRTSNTNLTSQNWRCDQENCKGSVATPLDFSDGVQVRVLQEHNHAPQPERVEAALAKDKMVDQAVASQHPPRRVISDTVAGVSDGGLTRMGKRSALRQKIHRKRRKMEGGGVHPVPLPRDSDFEVPDAYKTVLEGNRNVPFLAFDSRAPVDDEEQEQDDEEHDEAGRILAFGTERMSRLLQTANVWMMDATFKVVPTLFFQLLVIHAVYNGHVFPCLYVLMPRKDEDTYARVFGYIRDITIGNNYSPATCIMDLELAMHRAFRTIWPETQLQGCFFHLAQSVWRKTQELGLARLYAEDEVVRNSVKLLPSLAFLKSEDVPGYFDAVFDELPEDASAAIQELYTYFEAIYIGRKPQRGPRRRPRYPVQLWSVRDRTAEGIPRTNNRLEGFHRGIQQMFDGPKPSMWQFLKGIQKEHGYQHALYIQATGGESPKTERKYNVINRRLTTLIQRHEEGTIDNEEFIEGVRHNIDLV